MIRLMYVETKKKREMRAFFCELCEGLFEECPYWSISQTLAMHLRGTKHRQIVYLKIDEVETDGLHQIGTGFSQTDYLGFIQGKPRQRDVRLYEVQG